MIYDYAILGGGASGLSLAHRMSQHPWFANKSIAIIEKEVKDKNDRTWSFWEDKPGYYDHIVKKRWPKLNFFSSTLDKRLDIAPFEYKMIAGIDFYRETYAAISAATNIHSIHAEIQSVEDTGNRVQIKTSTGVVEANHAFKSYPSVEIDHTEHLYVDQHFKGFFIETREDAFDPDVATFMDFRIEQAGEVRFLYVLPTTARKALVEVAIFSTNILSQEAYDTILKDYIKAYIGVADYTIEEEEFGVIPMTPYPFHRHNTDHITHIGTGGGIVKASSGYAFSRVQQHSDQLIDCMVHGKPMKESYRGLMGRHSVYDKVMLHAMLVGGVPGDKIFTDLFEKKKGSLILKFLRHDTSFLEELNIFTAPPWWPFTKAFFKEVIF